MHYDVLQALLSTLHWKIKPYPYWLGWIVGMGWSYGGNLANTVVWIIVILMCILIVPMSLCVQTKLQWLCEEVCERESREWRLKRTLQQHKEQIKALKQSKDSELQSLLDRITLQDRLRKDIQSEKRGTNSPQRKVITRSDFMGPDTSAQIVMWSPIKFFYCIHWIKCVYLLADFYCSLIVILLITGTKHDLVKMSKTPVVL